MTVTLDEGVVIQTTGTAVGITASRNITVTAAGTTITATGNALVTNAPGTTAITAGSISTSGANAYGISANLNRLRLGSGNVRVSAQAVTMARGAGAGSVGIVAVGAGGDVSVNVGSITNPDGQGIVAYALSSGGSIEVTGAVNTGANAIYMFAVEPSAILGANPPTFTPVGDPAQRGRGSITVGKGGSLTSSGVAATMLVANGGTVNNNGTIQTLRAGGYALDLSYPGSTTVNNAGTLIGGIRGGGSLTDTLNNSGTLKAAGSPGSTTSALYSGIEFFNNSGLIDMRNGVAGDQITQNGTTATATAPGARATYVGSGNATVALEVAFTENGTIADRLLLQGATGNTKIDLRVVGNVLPSLLADGVTLVSVDPSANRGVFTLAQPLEIQGLRYNLTYDPERNSYVLYGAPSAPFLRRIKLPTITQAAWYRANDTVSAQLRNRRDRRWSDVEPQGGFWMQLLGSSAKQDQKFGRSIRGVDLSDVDLGYRQRSYSGQIGLDTAGPENGESGAIVGVTAGYGESTADFSGAADRVTVRSANAGVYANALVGPFHLGATVNYTHHALRDRIGALSISATPSGRTIGASVEGGIRLGGDTFFAEPSVGITYAVTRISSIEGNGAQIVFDDFTGNQGFASLRLGGRTALRSTDILWYVGGAAVHEFAGNDLTRLALRSSLLPVENVPQGTLGRATIGLTSGEEGRASLFVEARGDFGSGYSSFDSRAGLRVRF